MYVSHCCTLFITLLCTLTRNLSGVTARVENTEVVVEEDFGAVARICVVVDGDREIDLDMVATPSPGNATGVCICTINASTYISLTLVTLHLIHPILEPITILFTFHTHTHTCTHTHTRTHTHTYS